MRGLIDGLLLFLNFGQIGDYSRSITDNLIKYNNSKLEFLKDYEINSNLYNNNSIELLLDRANNNLSGLKKYLSNNNDIDFFHCLNNGFSFPKNFDFNYIMSISNLMPLFYEELCNDKYIATFFNKFPYSVLKSNYIVCPSISTKKDFLNDFSVNEKNIFVNYGILSHFFTKTDEFMTSIYLKSKFNLDFDFIIFYGDFNKRKSLDKSIILFSKLKKNYPNLHFLICSDNFNDSEYLNSLNKLSNSLGISKDIVFLNNLSILDKVNLFNKALFFIDLSIYENVNLNIVEAFSCEIPIICSCIDLYKEYFGDFCFYYEDHIDPICIMNYIQTYELHNKDYVTNKFDKNLNLNTILNVYNKFK